MATFNETIEDDLDGSDNLAELLTGLDILSESFDGGEDLLELFTGLDVIPDSLSYTEDFLLHWEGKRIFTETIGVQDFPKPGWKFFLTEDLDFSESQLIDWIVPLFDQLFTDDALKVQGNYHTILGESISIEELIARWKVFNDIISESYNLSEGLVDIHTKVGIILDILRIKETIVNTGTFQSFLADNLRLVDALERIFRGSLDETLGLADVVQENGIFLTLVDENFTIQDVISEIFTARVSVTDTFEGIDSGLVTGTYFALSNDSLIFRNELVISGQVFACWVLTTKNYNPSVYSNFDFNSYARSNKKLYGARSDGIYLLEGDDDSGKEIHTGLMFDFSNMDIPETKRIRSIHIGSRTTKATIQVSTDRGVGRTYNTINQRAVIGKEVIGKYWTVAVEDVEDLKSMELNVILLSKKR